MLFRSKIGEIFGVRVVSINNAELALAEELHLGSTVIGEGLVVVEVLVGDISENGDFDRDAEGAELGEGVGGGF